MEHNTWHRRTSKLVGECHVGLDAIVLKESTHPHQLLPPHLGRNDTSSGRDVRGVYVWKAGEDIWKKSSSYSEELTSLTKKRTHYWNDEREECCNPVELMVVVIVVVPAVVIVVVLAVELAVLAVLAVLAALVAERVVVVFHVALPAAVVWFLVLFFLTVSLFEVYLQ